MAFSLFDLFRQSHKNLDKDPGAKKDPNNPFKNISQDKPTLYAKISKIMGKPQDLSEDSHSHQPIESTRRQKPR